MNTDPDAWQNRPPLVCARLLACQNIRYDAADPDAGWSLDRVLVHVRLSLGPPATTRRECLFAQLHGTPGEYILRVRLVRIGQDEDGDAFELAEVADFGPWEIELPGGNYVECYGIPLGDVPFPEPGVYEFQLWADGFADMLMNERLEVRE